MAKRKAPAAKKPRGKNAAPGKKRPVGRPSPSKAAEYEAIIQRQCAEIIERLSNGEPLAWICRDEHMPAVRTVSDWRKARKDFAEECDVALDIGADAIAADALRIADDGSRDYVETENGPAVNHDHIQRAKLRVETRLKLLAKWHPKRYGDKVAHEGANGGPIEHVHRFKLADLE